MRDNTIPFGALVGRGKMLSKRISKLNNDKLHLDIRKRNQALLDIEGWYETTPDLPPLYKPFVEEYYQSNSKLKFTRWLTRKMLQEYRKSNSKLKFVEWLKHNVINNDDISAIGKLKTISFKISCRHNDLLRIADTPHYHSCFKGWRGKQTRRGRI